MKASELRIGNCVYALSDNNHSIKKVDTIAVITQYGWETVSGCSAIKPIPMDKNWLCQMGFIKDVHVDYRYHLIDKEIIYDLDDNCICISDSWEYGVIEYVHEMQNILFALFKEEFIK